MYSIRHVTNGYIIDLDGRGERVAYTLEEVFSYLLSMFEGRTQDGEGRFFGVVRIDRGQTLEVTEVPMSE